MDVCACVTVCKLDKSKAGTVRQLMFTLASVLLPERVKDSRIIAGSLHFPFIGFKKYVQKVCACCDKKDTVCFWGFEGEIIRFFPV